MLSCHVERGMKDYCQNTNKIKVLIGRPVPMSYSVLVRLPLNVIVQI